MISDMGPALHGRKMLTWAVLGGKYSKDHHTRSSFSACSIFLVIFMMEISFGRYMKKTEIKLRAVYR